MASQIGKERDEEDATPGIGEMKVNGAKLRGIPDRFRIPSLCDGIGEGIVAKKLGNQGGQEEDEIEKRGRMIDKQGGCMSRG